MLLVRREESKALMCFLGVFYVFLGVWKREKNVYRNWAERKTQKKKCVLSGLRGAGG